MLADRRSFVLKNGVEIKTPLLLPSFSSKTFPDAPVGKVIEYMSQVITDETLISAYDLYYGMVKKKLTFPSVIFLDSGGYEASQDADLSEIGRASYEPKRWLKSHHERVLSNWDYKLPTVLVSFDSPRAKAPIATQIKRARSTFGTFDKGNSEILFKTESKSQRYLNVDDVICNVHSIAEFDILGVTEKELGGSAIQRMLNISRIREALTSVGLKTPIHVFGSLDTISTVLYFLAGADIFDGLTWLRYAFMDGQTVYKHNYGAKELGITFEDYRVNGKVWNDNYYYLQKLKEDMEKFLHTQDFSSFTHNSDFFRKANELFAAKRA